MSAESTETSVDHPAVDSSVDYEPLLVEHALHPWGEYLTWEARHAAGNALELALATVNMVLRGSELMREASERETAAKHRIDARLTELGFSQERARCRRRSGAQYTTAIRFREGDNPKLRKTCIALGHGLTAGYEASASILDSIDTDYPLTDYTLLLYNRPGVDASQAPKFITDYNPRTHFADQVYGQEQMLNLVVRRGAERVFVMPHSMDAKVAQRNVRNMRQWDPETRAAFGGGILLNAPDDQRSVYASSPVGRLSPVAKALAIAARQTHRPEGSWTHEAVNGLPEPARRIVSSFSPEVVSRFLASHLIIDKMIGEVDSDVYHAAKWRAKHTNWRTLVYDLDSMDHGVRGPLPDFAIGTNFLMFEGQHDRLVKPGSGRGVQRLFDLHGRGGEYNVVRHVLPTGHFSHAEQPGIVNREAYLFAARPEFYVNWYHARRKGFV